jgi:hypothetical protein
MKDKWAMSALDIRKGGAAHSDQERPEVLA